MTSTGATQLRTASVDEGIGLSAEVAAAVGLAVDLCRRLLADLTEPVGREAPG